MSAVEFDVRVVVADENPEILEYTPYRNRYQSDPRVVRFLAENYVAMQDWANGGWQWRRTGPVLTVTGHARADRRLDYRMVDDVPAYAKAELARVVAERADEAKARIDFWVALARATEQEGQP